MYKSVVLPLNLPSADDQENKLFAAIDVGSFEIAMKIYEISSKNGMKEIDHVRHRLALGYDTDLYKKYTVSSDIIK